MTEPTKEQIEEIMKEAMLKVEDEPFMTQYIIRLAWQKAQSEPEYIGNSKLFKIGYAEGYEKGQIQILDKIKDIELGFTDNPQNCVRCNNIARFWSYLDNPTICFRCKLNELQNYKYTKC